MKKWFCLLLTIVMGLSLACFAGCGEADTQKYIDRIAELEAQLKNSGAEEVTSLKSKVTALESTVKSLKEVVESATSGNAALRAQLDSLTETVEALRAQLPGGDYAERIAALEKAVADKETGNVALKKQIAALEAADEASEAELAALRAELTAGKDEIAALKDKITALESTVGDDTKGLVSQIAALTALIEETKAALDASNGKIEEMQADITALTNELTVANTRITLLENINSGNIEPHIYTVCEDAPAGQPAADNTFTFVNNGIKLFSVKITKWFLHLTETYATVVTFVNHNIPSCVPMGSYFAFYAYDAVTDTYYKFNETMSNTLKLGETFTRNMDFYNAPGTVSEFIVGIPIQDSTKQSILPYATFRLPA